jgi:hypothetical protein
MRRLTILLLLVGMGTPAFGSNPVTLDLVEQLLIYAHGKPDAKVAEELFELELTERVSAARLARWEAKLPGPKSRQALVALADAAAFLRLPPGESPFSGAPGRTAQAAMMTLARNYVTDSIPKLPNFFATRDTTRFSDEPEDIGMRKGADSGVRQLHLVGISSDKVYFREGKEVVEAGTEKKLSFFGTALTTRGIFGEVMELVLTDVLPGGLEFSHWEGSADAPLAVFRYAVPVDKSHYAVTITNATTAQSQPDVAYHGEIAIDPANGAILRLTALADMSGSSPISKAGVMVEYAPVEIGGVRYICPVKSVSLTVAQALKATANSQGRFGTASTRVGVPLTKVNDVQFTQYHLFRAEMRILTGDDAAPNSTPPAAAAPPHPAPNR